MTKTEKNENREKSIYSTNLDGGDFQIGTWLLFQPT